MLDFYGRIKYNSPRNRVEALLCRFPWLVDWTVARWKREPYLLEGAFLISMLNGDTGKEQQFIFCKEIEFDDMFLHFSCVHGPQKGRLERLPGEDALEWANRAAAQPGCYWARETWPLNGPVVCLGAYEYTAAAGRVISENCFPLPPEEGDGAEDDPRGTMVITHPRFRRKEEPT